MTPLRRLITPQIKVLDEKEGIVEYVASDESLDCYAEIIRASGWRFTHFDKNAPFVDSHDYSCIEKLVGSVEDRRVEGSRLIEVVRWAIDVPENRLAHLGFRMTAAGYLKAVSVGFQPLRSVSRFGDTKDWTATITALGLTPEIAAQVRTIYLEQEQLELSSCILGANPNALARAYKAGAVSDDDLGFIEQISFSENEADKSANNGEHALKSQAARRAWLREFQNAVFKL